MRSILNPLPQQASILNGCSGFGVASQFARKLSSFLRAVLYFQGNIWFPRPLRRGYTAEALVLIPRGEGKGLPDAIHDFFGRNTMPSRCADSRQGRIAEGALRDSQTAEQSSSHATQGRTRKPWPRIEQALRVTDLLLQGGGFSTIVLDMGSLAPEYASRVPLATWFRYRAAAEHSQTSLLLLTQQACAKSSAGLVLHMQTAKALQEEATVFTGVQYGVEVARERFQPVSVNVVPMRKPPQSERRASWQSKTAWAGRR